MKDEELWGGLEPVLSNIQDLVENIRAVNPHGLLYKWYILQS